MRAQMPMCTNCWGPVATRALAAFMASIYCSRRRTADSALQCVVLSVGQLMRAVWCNSRNQCRRAAEVKTGNSISIALVETIGRTIYGGFPFGPERAGCWLAELRAVQCNAGNCVPHKLGGWVCLWRSGLSSTLIWFNEARDKSTEVFQ